MNCRAFYKLSRLYHAIWIFESTVVLEILSYCPECVVVLFCAWLVVTLSNVDIVIVRC
jgi:hypothetical protein